MIAAEFEPRSLTEENLAIALRGEVYHPISAVILKNTVELETAAEEYPRGCSNDVIQPFLVENYGHLVDSIVDVGPFTLHPDELISVWAGADKLFTRPPQEYLLARTVAVAYAVQAEDEEKWLGLPRHFLHNPGPPSTKIYDANGLTRVLNKMRDVSASLGEMNRFFYGFTESPTGRASDLTKRVREGDESARLELEKLLAIPNPPDIVGKLKENFGNGMGSASICIQESLEAHSK